MSKELKKIVDQDVIESVKSSEFISPIVVTTRKDRPDSRLCVDLREPNKSVVVNDFPPPYMVPFGLAFAPRKYSTVEKEALRCVWATERCRTYFHVTH